MAEEMAVKDAEAAGTNPFDSSYDDLRRGYDSAVVRLLSEMGNFKIRIARTSLVADSVRYLLEPNRWIAEQLTNGTSHISSASIVLSPDSVYPSVLYSHGIAVFRPQIFYRARSVREEYNIYYVPFSPEVWISLAGLLLVVAVALAFILGRETELPHDVPYDLVAKVAEERGGERRRWSEADEREAEESAWEREGWELGEILLVAVGALGQQGSSRDPSTGAARTLLLVAFVLAVLTYTAYSASVIAFVSLLPTAEKEERQLPKNILSQRKVVLHDTGFLARSLQSLFPGGTYADLERGVDDALSGSVLFAAERDTALTYINRRGYGPEQRCCLARAFLGFEYQWVFALRNDTSLREVINANVIRLRQYGFLSREGKRFFDVRYPCSFKERSSAVGFVSFNLDDIKPALYLLGFGGITSIFLLLFECLTFSSWKALKEKFAFGGRRKRRTVKKVGNIFDALPIATIRGKLDGLEGGCTFL